MRVQRFSIFLLIAILSYPVFSMGTKNDAQQTEAKPEPIKGTPKELAEQLIKTAHWVEFPDFNKFLAPLEAEFKALGIPAKPFEKTFNKFNELAMQVAKPFLNVIQKPLIDQAVQYFTQDELKELIQVYQKPIMQKQYDFMLGLLINTGLSVLQDPAVLAQYSQEFMGVFMSMALLNNPKNIGVKMQEITKTFKEDLDLLQKSVKMDDPEFKEKLQKRYKSIAGIIQGLDFTKATENLKALSGIMEHKLDFTMSDQMPSDTPNGAEFSPQAAPVPMTIPNDVESTTSDQKEMPSH